MGQAPSGNGDAVIVQSARFGCFTDQGFPHCCKAGSVSNVFEKLPLSAPGECRSTSMDSQEAASIVKAEPTVPSRSAEERWRTAGAATNAVGRFVGSAGTAGEKQSAEPPTVAQSANQSTTEHVPQRSMGVRSAEQAEHIVGAQAAEPIAGAQVQEENVGAQEPPHAEPAASDAPAEDACQGREAPPVSCDQPRDSRNDEPSSCEVVPTKSRRWSVRDDRSDLAKTRSAKGSHFPQRTAGEVLSMAVWQKAEELFKCIDADGSNALTREEAAAYFCGVFKKVSVQAMFQSMDKDMSGAITGEQFMQFWREVKSQNHTDEQIVSQIQEILDGNQWHSSGGSPRNSFRKAGESKWPPRPWVCRLSKGAWDKSEALFRAMCGSSGQLLITREKACKFFQGTFAGISVNAMFHEVDVHCQGTITVEAWINFWKQVRSNGYSNQSIIEEIDGMLDGGEWVDWKDGRTT